MDTDNEKTTKSDSTADRTDKNPAKAAADAKRKAESGDSGTTASGNRSNPDTQAGDQHSEYTKNRQRRQHDAVSDGPDTQNDEKVMDLQQEVVRLTEELEKARDGMLRKAAEFENLKKRTQKEKALLFDQARADAVSRFLPIREDLKRSVEASKGHKLDKSFVDGLKLVLANFEHILKEYGVEPIEETGVPFDVDKHDAMLIQPAADDSTESNTVIQVLEPGYHIGDRIIKHAKVIVSQ